MSQVFSASGKPTNILKTARATTAEKMGVCESRKMDVDSIATELARVELQRDFLHVGYSRADALRLAGRVVGRWMWPGLARCPSVAAGRIAGEGRDGR